MGRAQIAATIAKRSTKAGEGLQGRRARGLERACKTRQSLGPRRLPRRCGFQGLLGRPDARHEVADVGRMQMARDESEQLKGAQQWTEQRLDGGGLRLGHDKPWAFSAHGANPSRQQHRLSAPRPYTVRPRRQGFHPSQLQMASPMMSFLSASGIQSISSRWPTHCRQEQGILVMSVPQNSRWGPKASYIAR